MLDNYLRDGETIESRIDELLTDVRASGTRMPDVALARLTEANTLARLIPAAVVELEPATWVTNNFSPSTPAEVGDSLGEPVYTVDDVTKALDGVFDGGQAPTVLRAAFLALLADGLSPVDKVSVEDTALLDPLADGTTPRLPSEEKPRSYVDTGSDIDVAMPEHADDGTDLTRRQNEHLAEDDDFPEFAEPKPKKRGKKTAAERAAEEAGA